MRKTGGRLLAGIAAGALGAALIPFVGVGVANAAFTNNTVGVPDANPGTNVRAITENGTTNTLTQTGVIVAGSTVVLNVTATHVTGSNSSVDFTFLPTAGITLTGGTISGDGSANAAWSAAGETITLSVPSATANGPVNSTITFTAPATLGTALTLATSGTNPDPVFTTVSSLTPAYSTSSPNAYRVGLAEGQQNIALTGSALNAYNLYIVCAVSSPTGGTYTPLTTGAAALVNGSATSGQINLGAFTGNPGQYLLGVYAGTTRGGFVDCATPGDSVLLSTFPAWAGGAINAFSLNPVSASAAPAVASPFVMSFTDVAGRPTLPLNSTDFVTLTGTGVTFDPVNGVIGNTQIVPRSATQRGDVVRFTAAAAAGSYLITATSINSTVTPQTATLTVGSTGIVTATTTLQAVTNSAIAETSASTSAARAYVGSTALRAIRFNVSGLVPGAAYNAVQSGTAANWASTGNAFVASADGTGTFVAAATIDSTAGETLIYTITGAGTSGVRTATVTFRAPAFAIDAAPAVGSTVFAAASSAVPVVVTIEDQFGNPATGAAVTITTGATTAATGLTNASGVANLSVTAPASGSTVFTLAAVASTGVVSGGGTFTVTVGTPRVTITGGVSTAITPVRLPTINENGLIAGATRVSFNVNGPSGAIVPSAQVSLSGSEGVWFVEGGDPTNEYWTAGSATVTGTMQELSNQVWAYSTKSGPATIKVSAGSVDDSGTVTVLPAVPAAARNIAVSAPTTVETGGLGVVTVTVTDNFGNPVQSAGGAAVTNLVMGIDSPGFFGNGLRSVGVVTDATGRGQVTVGAAIDDTGTVRFSGGAAGTTNQFGALANRLQASNTVDTAPGYTASNAPVTTEVRIIPGIITKSISIAGTRTTVSGKPGIEVIGETVGIENGKTVKPYFRFPGQTSYTEGSARPVVNGDEFTWTRKTGKKIYVYVTSDDGTAKSNRLIIAAS